MALKKAARAKLPISDDMFFVIATTAILASDRFLQATDAWEEKLIGTKFGLSGNTLTSPPTNTVKIAFALQEIQVAKMLTRPTSPPPLPMTNKSQSKIPYHPGRYLGTPGLLFEQHVRRCCQYSHSRVPRRR